MWIPTRDVHAARCGYPWGDREDGLRQRAQRRVIRKEWKAALARIEGDPRRRKGFRSQSDERPTQASRSEEQRFHDLAAVSSRNIRLIDEDRMSPQIPSDYAFRSKRLAAADLPLEH